MLQSLHVKNLALIEEAEVEFKKGLNILTGETGAGKSIIIGSVNLALGGRYTADIIRRGADYGLVELIFSIESRETEARLKELDIFPEEGQLILSRKFMDGRSISRINGETVSIGQLKEVSSVLIDIHGQHEHQSLLYRKNHLEILDAFAGKEAEESKKELGIHYKEYKSLREKLSETHRDEETREKELSLLQYETEEIRNAQLQNGEDEELERSYSVMLNSRKIAESVQEAYNYTTGADMGSASELLSRAVRSLQDAAGYDEKAQKLCEQLIEVDSLLNDFNRELSEYSKSFDFSPEEFQETEQRLNEINHLKSKYGNTIEQILEYCEEKEKRLAVLQDFDQYKSQLEKALTEEEKVLLSYCDTLYTIRKKAAKELEALITQGLLDLNFLEVQFGIAFEKTGQFTANGTDEVEFMVSMNPGEPVRPLKDVASGGELSRIMLAIKTVMAKKDEIETLIFDEIDVGISGRTAQKVSEKMELIGKSHQVICITHLAQIAAMADSHFLIEKKVKDNATITDIRLLSIPESVEELARILGGAKITEAVLQNALEMKELAAKTK